MRIFFIPIEMNKDVLFLHRMGEDPILFMQDVQIVRSAGTYHKHQNTIPAFTIYGDFANGQSFTQLQDGDRLLYTIKPYAAEFNWGAFYLDMYAYDGLLLPFQSNEKCLAIAAGMEASPKVFCAAKTKQALLTKAENIYSKAKDLYTDYPEYQHIMTRSANDQIMSQSLVKLASIQPEEKHDEFIALFLAMSATYRTFVSIANRILENCKYEKELSLLTQEEQVGTFIEFSKMAASHKQEYVSDQMIDAIKDSDEYAQVLTKFEEHNLGLSSTQQFNVFQQVGYFSKNHKSNILYNLSDMGAGKTLMTVEAIYLLDLKQISNWAAQKETIIDQIENRARTFNHTVQIDTDVLLLDKHIIAPTLSIRSSWVDTFRLFYDVTQIDEWTYELSMEYEGIRAKSYISIAPFTVKNGKIFAKNKLAKPRDNTYLIIDEIHQLVTTNIARTKFFPSGIIPVDIYKTFILSGTMSNLKTKQWLNYMKFMGMSLTSSKEMSSKAMHDDIIKTHNAYCTNIKTAAKNIKTTQHCYFENEPVSEETYYTHTITKKQALNEEYFFTKYGTQILAPRLITEQTNTIERLLTNESMDFDLITDPMEIDTINFELFYQIVGSQAITAQSMQVAEELFGTQQKQHVSDIIKTASPLSKSDIAILKTLHQIAENHNQYKSTVIAKAINNAILNLNDGLQTKNIYEIISKYAESNLKFFEYLSTLDVNILEQLPASGLIQMPKLQDTDKFKVLKDILQREKEETHLIVVNDFYALKSLSEALGIEYLTKNQLKQELDYQDLLDDLYKKQSIVVVTQDMIKSSLDLVQANRLIQYQLNTEISDIIQTQNRINRIGQTRETRGYYIASDSLQENLIKLFLESYRNIRVAHKGIVELFADITSQINVVNDYLDRAFIAMESESEEENDTDNDIDNDNDNVVDDVPEFALEMTDLLSKNPMPQGAVIAANGNISRAILFPQNHTVIVLLPLTSGTAFPYGQLNPEKADALNITQPMQILWNLESNKIES